MKRFTGTPDYDVIALLRDCNPRGTANPEKPAYRSALDLGLIEVVPAPDPEIASGAKPGSVEYIKRTEEGTEYLLWARSMESIG